MPHVFEPLFAEKYSMNGAVLIQEIDFWLSVNKANGVNFVDGKYWTYFTADKYCNSHRYFTPTKFHSAIQGLLAEKVIEVGCFNENKFNRTKWYTFTDEFLKEHGVRLTCVISTTAGEIEPVEPIDGKAPLETKKPKVKKEVKKYEMEDEGGELKAAHEFYKLLLKLNPGYKEPNFQKWAKDFDMMFNKDGRTKEEVWAMMLFVHNHKFWKGNILSPAKLREKFDALVIQQKTDKEKFS